MKRISTAISGWCRRNCQLEEAEFHIVEYGIQLLLNTSVKVIIILLTGMVLGYFREVLIAMSVFSAIRYFAGGYHSRTDLGCLGIMLFICLCPIPLFRLSISVSIMIWGLIIVYSAYGIIRYAPRNSTVNPVRDPKIMAKKRKGSIIACAIAVLLIVFSPVNDLRWLVAMPLFIEAITISPIFYGKGKMQKEF